MTFSEWCNRVGVKPTHPTTERGAVSFVRPANCPMWSELFHLSDYTVSSVCGAVVWLVPKRGKTDERRDGADDSGCQHGNDVGGEG